ncbi:hypothetical protein MHUMG1_10134 [Metarhizium humberi]|uniref:Uncharacterized protein n=1 Tax=Metarhizium humberi TaxID=2596975 RepID=A0A9P8M215_9HYPO|nr:hypothetical protein MHUMG1_10134 [Metarhizium humberi]
MHYTSVISVLAALGSVVNAAPALDAAFSSVANDAPALVNRQELSTYTLQDKKAPFQDAESLPALNGADTVDLDLSGYTNMGYPETSDQFKCHGSAGIVFRIWNTEQRCHHPYMVPFLRFAFVDCKDVEGFTPYPPVKGYKAWCKWGKWMDEIDF